jgi:hypothetical protein
MSRKAPSPVFALHAISRSFGAEAAHKKQTLLTKISSQRRFRVKELVCLHDTLNFMRAYPDNPRILERVRELVPSLRRHAGAVSLRDTGFPGSSNTHPYAYAVLQRMVRLFPGCLELDWSEVEETDALESALSFAVSLGEIPGLEDTRLTLAEWLERCKSRPEQTDLELVLEMLGDSELSPRVQATFFEADELPVVYQLRRPGSGRGEVAFPPGRIHYQKRDIVRERFDLVGKIVEPIKTVASMSPADGRKLVDVSLAALCARNLEIYPLIHANPRDVTLADCGRGLQVVLVGVVPEFRSALESLFFFLILKNGVPIAYGPAGVFLGCCEMGINLFPEFRAGEIRYLYAQFMRVMHQVLGAEYFFLTRYGMGEDNDDAIRSGAFWFYRKLGFATTNPKVEALAGDEEEKMRADPGYRSSIQTLRRLSHTEAVLDLSRGACQPTDFGRLGVLQSRYIAERFGGDRKRAEVQSAAKVAKVLKIPKDGRALATLAPLLCMMPKLATWSAKDKARLAAAIRAKDGRSEIAATRLFSRHRTFRAAIARLAASGEALRG